MRKSEKRKPKLESFKIGSISYKGRMLYNEC